MARVLIIDDNKGICDTLIELVHNIGHNAESAYNCTTGLQKATQGEFDVVFIDVQLPDGNGLETLSQVKALPEPPEVIIMTGAGNMAGAEIAIRNGAWDYLQKPLYPKEILLSLTRVLKYRDNLRELSAAPPVKRCGIIGQSQAITATLDKTVSVARGSANVLITGETGCGKELFARALHTNSQRSEGPFIVVDCASIPAELIESTLFGHIKGAFTDAKAANSGLISEANGGTLFLDELGEIPLDLQKKLLRVLQEKRYRAVGGSQEISSDFRLVAATHRNLENLVANGTFREDLLYRISSVCITVPPLRDRLDDLDELVEKLSERIYNRDNIAPKTLSENLMDVLKQYRWPGNVRELKNTLESAILGAWYEPELFVKHLPDRLRIQLLRDDMDGPQKDSCPSPMDCKHLPEIRIQAGVAALLNTHKHCPDYKVFREELLQLADEAYFTRLLLESEDNIQHACKISGLGKSRLYEQIKRFDIGRD